MKYYQLFLFFIFISHMQSTYSGGIRDHTRPMYEVGDRSESRIESIKLSQDQENELTLTLVEVEKQDVKTWVRLAAGIDKTKKVLTAKICNEINRVTYGGDLIKINQRVLVFPPSSKSSVFRATVSKVYHQQYCLVIEAKLTRRILLQDRFYIMEIIVPRGRFLVVPKEAIIEESHRQIVYIKTPQGSFIPKEIYTGLKGDLYTEIKHGLIEGEEVVTLGSFFIDAQYKLKNSSNQNLPDKVDVSIKPSEKNREASHAHHHH